MTTLCIRQSAPQDGRHRIRLTLKRPGQPDLEADADIEFALTEQEQEDIRWYLEDYLQHAEVAQAITAEQVEDRMKALGEELHSKVLAFNGDTQAIWFSVRNQIADLRVEITTGVAEAASIPWELMRDPLMDSPVSLRVKAFVRVQSNPNISFVPVSPADDGRIRLLYIACRPKGSQDVELRAVANHLLHDLGTNRRRFDIKALRPPTFERLQKELGDAKNAGRPYHVVHFDGHGIYADLTKSQLADWFGTLSSLTLGTKKNGKHGYLLFEHPSKDKMRPVDGQTLGQLLHDNGVPVLTLNACQSAMHEVTAASKTPGNGHNEVRAIGSLAQAVVDQGIPAVLGMRYSVYVVTAAQYIGQLYAALAGGRGFGQAASEGRKHLWLNPERWVGLQPRPLQDWSVPIAYEAAPIELRSADPKIALDGDHELDPIQHDAVLRRYVPTGGFIGRDETILALDRAFDDNRVVLLHAYAGQGKTSTAVEFARWYSVTGGLGPHPGVLLASFEGHTDLADQLNQIGQLFGPLLESKGIHWSALNDIDQRRELVCEILRQFPVLWIWDNVEPIAGFPDGTESQWTMPEQNELRDFLQQLQLDSVSKVKVLLTSRRDEAKWLGGIPHRISMPRMRNSDAAQLALKLGQEKDVHRAQIADWQPLLNYCSGNPLTLRVLVSQAAKSGARGKKQVEDFVEAIRRGEQRIDDADEKEGRDRSLGASLDYGFRQAFKDGEYPIIALLQLFQGTIDVDALIHMGRLDDHALPELKGRTKQELTDLLLRARDMGLLTQVTDIRFGIHPALPWFLRHLFVQHYDGRAGRSTAQTALRAWAETIGALSGFYHNQFIGGNRDVIDHLELEESNILAALRLLRRNGWESREVSCMQGLGVFYEYRGRMAEWARLVEEIRGDYCTEDDRPIPGREEDYTIVMGYRVDLARDYERDLVKATTLQEKVVQRDRDIVASILGLPKDGTLDSKQRNQLRTLAVSIEILGHIERNAHNPRCIERFNEAIEIHRWIKDDATHAITEFNLGIAYLSLPSIYDLNAAEAAFQRSLALHSPKDSLGRAKCTVQIGTVHHSRFRDGLKQDAAKEVVLQHARAAETHYREGLALCPKDAPTDLGPVHNQLGALYSEVGRFDHARENFERAAQYFEATDSRFQAGQTRFNMANMYLHAAQIESQPVHRRARLLSARAHAEAALRDFQHYRGRAAQDEEQTQQLLAVVVRFLAELGR